LRPCFAGRHDEQVAYELPLDRDDVVTMMEALIDIRSDVEWVTRLLEEDDEEEEEGEDDA
jgi:hypothetical protein